MGTPAINVSNADRCSRLNLPDASGYPGARARCGSTGSMFSRQRSAVLLAIKNQDHVTSWRVDLIFIVWIPGLHHPHQEV